MKRLIIPLLIICSYVTIAQQQSSLLYTQGRKIMDSCGDEIIPIGVNLGNMWEYEFGVNDYAEIKKIGANCVRIALTTHYQDWQNGGQWVPLSNEQLESIIKGCVDNKMIPIVTLHDWTATNSSSSSTSLPLATAWWTDAGRLAILKKYQHYLILNVANEPENNSNSQVDYYNASKDAIIALRNAGLTCPIMIDSYDWGHSVPFANTHGPRLIDDDPLHKIIMSIHAYWPPQWYTDADIESMIDNMYDANIPYVIGALAANNGDLNQPISYQLIMKKATEKKIGWQVWWWGFENPGANTVLSMTNNGDSSGLSGFGLDMAITNAFSIKKTAITPKGILNDGCESVGINDVYKENHLLLFPNPSQGFIYIETKKGGTLTIRNITGKILLNQHIKRGKEQIEIPRDWPEGIYIVTCNGATNKLILSK